MRSFLALLCIGLSFVLSGCGSTPERRLDAPSLRVTALDATSLSLRITNANTAPLVIARSTHTLYLGDDDLGRIDDRSSVGVPPLGAVTHTVTLPSDVADRVRARLASSPGQLRASVESRFELIVTPDDTLTLKSFGTGLVPPAQ